MQFRSDLAVEQITAAKLPAGVHMSKRGKAFEITEIVIDNDDHKRSIGKGKGRYITLEGGSLSRFSDSYQDMASE